MGALSPDGHGVRGELGLLTGAEEPLAGEAPEGRPEVDAVEGVDEGIDGAVEPSQPGEGLGQHLAGLVLGQKWCDQIVNEEGQPAGNEATHNNTQGLSGLVLLLQRGNPIGQRFVGIGGLVASTAGRSGGHARLVMVMRMMMVMAPQSILLPVPIPLPMRMPKAVRSRWLAERVGLDLALTGATRRLGLPLGIQETAARPHATGHCGNGRRGGGSALQRVRSCEFVAAILGTAQGGGSSSTAGGGQCHGQRECGTHSDRVGRGHHHSNTTEKVTVPQARG